QRRNARSWPARCSGRSSGATPRDGDAEGEELRREYPLLSLLVYSSPLAETRRTRLGILSRLPPRTADDAAGRGARVFSIAEDLDAVDEDVKDARGETMRVLVRRGVLDAAGIEHDDVREMAGLGRAPLADLQVFRRQRGQAPDRLGERDHLLVAHVFSEEPREVSVRPRMGPRLEKRAFGS